MALPSGHLRSKLIKQFTGLGPYIREEKCTADRFFFDCLAICVNVKSAPENREFWGWWMEFTARADHFTYEYYFGIYDKQGVWQSTAIKTKENSQQLEATLHHFCQRLKAMLMQHQLSLKPALGFNDVLVELNY